MSTVFPEYSQPPDESPEEPQETPGESQPTEEADVFPAAAPDPVAPPDTGNPQPSYLVAEVQMDCQICRQPIRQGDTYVQGQARGPTHVEPCSHQAD